MIKDNIFRAYDIRGIYPSEINEDVSELIGKGFGTFIGGAGKRIAVGRDVRLSSESLSNSLINGLTSVGIDVLDLGVVPTPVVYFAINHWNLDGGVVVSASHNPPEWNGFKLCREKARLVGSGLGLEEIKKLIQNENFKLSKDKGKVANKREDILREYETFILDKITLKKSFKVGVDPGNGSCSCIAKEILEKFGLSVKAINDTPDGRFPSRSPEPTEESVLALKELIISENLNFGVAFDGDCDRALFIDDKGDILRGDIVLALFVKHFLEQGDRVVYEVSCSTIVEDEIKSKGGVPVLTRVGHSFILDKMISEKAKFGGEISSHLYFGDIYGLDDALFAVLKVAELLSLKEKSLSQLVDELPKYETYRENFEIPDVYKFKVIENIQEKFQREGYNIVTIDGVKVVENEGWFILRASNTLPQIKLTVEARNKESLQKLAKLATKNLFEAYEKLKEVK
ncbi:MAG: phosphomannomutase/phosphoglucomutase [Thermoproteota archaeon]|nr:phosphomannomutase/phosphoglucomutase [Candidatus Brockarchaeota archaeon]MBO3768172.1 phosphomannomutase/phosphoglucomutase [Candidatus Brockarchaeota archaeon]MBO3801882.1 phosphomannomutase/phosphoglucomutase [Candidatus Brockarchaeota archaeon]